ncbi:MAG: TrkH family potassium uptake protein [Prevotella sp.]|uniref:TrkH family potassium uptake protein n=1 Tax=Prevotella sp. TaxID=59823 RepID=UPI002A2A99DF|nr:TrkH family potassium uptake protein [Prevotella sp.]MDD7318873.1 TrkH family potassium uptake protein [Prevotellaceae bacterium]MDY4019252.1 TrkH family potassium uptake protein [Prevotella sp.]
MLNLKIIYKIIGQLLYIEAFMMVTCIVMTCYYGEDDFMGFIFSTITTVVAALVFRYLGKNAKNSLGRREAYLLVTAVWLVFSFFGALPFYITGYLPHFTDAYFETMSGFTTTGASVIESVERLPHALKFWRSLTHWIGGLGIVFFTIAIIPSLVGGNMRVFSAEATGPIRAKMHPRLKTTAKWIWSIYGVLTIACAGCFFIAGMNVFDSVNYSMAITATGGFATHDASAGYFHSAAIDYTAIAFMFLSGISFTLLYALFFKGKVKSFFKNSELRLYISLVVIATAAIMYFLLRSTDYSFHDAFRKSLFQVVSFITTTGVFNDDAGKWPHITWVILSVCMFFGGCAGSTSGGFKCVRGVIVLKVLLNELKHVLHPHAILPVRVNDRIIPYGAQVSVLIFLVLYVMLCLLSYFIMILSGVDSTNSITIALSCASNVGPTLGLEIGPTMSWTILPDIVKWILSILMLIGRLEIITVVVLFTSSFWKDN